MDATIHERLSSGYFQKVFPTTRIVANNVWQSGLRKLCGSAVCSVLETIPLEHYIFLCRKMEIFSSLENSLRLFLFIMLPTTRDVTSLLILDVARFAPHFRVAEVSSINCVNSSTWRRGTVILLL